MAGTSCSRKYQKSSKSEEKSSGVGCGAFLFGLALAVVSFVVIVSVFAK